MPRAVRHTWLLLPCASHISFARSLRMLHAANSQSQLDPDACAGSVYIPKLATKNPTTRSRCYQPSFCYKHCKISLLPCFSLKTEKGLQSQIAQPFSFSIETNGIKGYTTKRLLGIHPNNHGAIRGRVSFCFRGLRVATRSSHETQGISLIRKLETGPLDHFPF